MTIPTRINADVYHRAHNLAKLEHLSLPDALERILAGDKAVETVKAQAAARVKATTSTPWTPPAGIEAWSQLAAAFDAAPEAKVSLEVVNMLRHTFGATYLGEHPAGTVLPRGHLVYMAREHRGKPKGICRGDPDHSYMRVGWWGWIGVELKARGKAGACAGTLTAEQKTAVASGLYPIAWAPSQVAAVIEAMDRNTGYTTQNGETNDGHKDKEAGADNGPQRGAGGQNAGLRNQGTNHPVPRNRAQRAAARIPDPVPRDKATA